MNATSGEWLTAEQLTDLRPDFRTVGFAQARARGLAVAHAPAAKACAVLRGRDSIGHLGWLFLNAPEAASDARVTTPQAFDAWIAAHEESVSALVDSRQPDEPDGARAPSGELALESIDAEASPIVRFVDSTLFDALRSGASDVHLESAEDGIAVKFRLDGVLVPVGKLGGTTVAEQVVSRIKVASELDIAERRVPQDGRMRVGFEGRGVDIRVSVMPSVRGEDVVLRILDREHLARTMHGLTLDRLGFDADSVTRFARLCAQPHGLVLVTGPTGSGKTTTLYAALAQTRDPREKVITIEDPVEYQLDGVLQIPVNERKGLSFARGLRSILRHDPDRILVGEIRDAETATIAIQSAMTGHLVYATLHANGALEVISRLEQLGVERAGLAAALTGVLAQRLVRQLCAECSVAAPDRPGWRHAVGCARCRGTGYRGRRAIGELLVVDPTLRDAISAGAPASRILELARAGHMTSLRERAIRLGEAGLTSQEEIDRVTLAG